MSKLNELVLSVAANPAIDSAIIQLVQGITSTALASANIPAPLKAFLQEVEANAVALAGAALNGTPAATEASATTQAAGTQAVATAKAS